MVAGIVGVREFVCVMGNRIVRLLVFVGVLAVVCSIGIVSFAKRAKSGATPKPTPTPVAKQQRIPEVITLAQNSKLGSVRFNHVKHNGGEYNADGPITCIQCHHTAVSPDDLVRIPPHTTVWPAGRTTSLTAELFAEDPKKAGVAACRDCHAREGQKPKLLERIPVIKDPETETDTIITNQVAFHSSCDVCHFEIGFRNSKTKAPSVTNCTSCHKR